MGLQELKAEAILLSIVVATVASVAVIQTVKTGEPPDWFETSLLPVAIASLMSIKLGVEKTLAIQQKEEDKNGPSK